MSFIKQHGYWVLAMIGIMSPLLFLIDRHPHSFSDPMWEIVHTPDSSAEMMRTPVPHGWVLTYKKLARTMVYIPDENHEWKIK